jgi:hypothetical protein
MNKKELIALGVSEELADQVIVEHGKDIESIKRENVMYHEQVETLQEQLTKANQTVESFNKMDIDSIKATAEQYKIEAEQTREEAEARLYQMQFDHQLSDTLRAVGARNPVTVMALLDYEKLGLAEDGETIIGLEEQVLQVAEQNPFLFDTSEETPEIVTGSHNHSVIGDTTVEAARKAAGLV